MRFHACLALLLCWLPPLPAVRAADSLPLSTRFVGEARYRALCERAHRENWPALPVGERIRRTALSLEGVPYVNYTLEIDNRIEAASANFEALDCWTFMEICLDFARLIRMKPYPWTQEDLLREIERTRYYGGEARGDYLRRIHYLEEWYPINARAGILDDLTRPLGGVRMKPRPIREMTVNWRNYRYLAANPSAMLPRMADYEARLSDLVVYHIPKSQVARIENKLQDGDLIGISTTANGSYCSHVGLAIRDEDGVLRFMHASKNNRRVVIDRRLSDYLAVYKYHAGILIGRAREP